MRLRSISILSLLPLWVCLLCGQLPAQEAPTPAVPMAPVEVPLPAQGPGQGQAQTQGTAQAPVQAQPGPTLSSSVSSNKQFVVHGADLAVRSAFCIMSEETAGTLGRLLKDEGRYAIPVVVEVKTPPNVNPAEPTVRPRISLMDFGGFHLQLSVQLRNDFRTEDYNRELVRILLAERILRNHKDINTQREKDILPEWLLTGVTQAMEFRSRSRPSVLFAAVFKSGQVYSIDRILAADPKNLDALSRGIYEVSSCALLLTLLDQPDGPLRVTKFLDALAVDDRPDRELLQQHFPTLGASKNSMEKWWTLQMASLATPSAFETMTIKETEEMLDKALTLHFTDRIGEEPADIKAGREGKGILGWLKGGDKKNKDKGAAKQEDAAVAASSAPGTDAAGTGTAPVSDMRVSNNASSALPVEGTSSDIPPPLGRPVPGSDLPPLPSSLAPSSATPPSPDAPPMPPAPETPSASASGTPAPAPASTDAAASTPPADSPKEKDKEATAPAPAPGSADKADAEAKPKKEDAAPEATQEKPKPRRTAPKPAAKPAEPKPAAATPDKPGTAPAPAAQDGKDKPADPAKPADAPPEEKKRFRFPKIFGGKDVTYTIMLLAMAAVVENATAKEDPKAKPPEEATPALPRNNRRVGSRPAGVPEAPKPAAAPTPAPAPVPAPKPAAPAPAPATNAAEAAPASPDEAAAAEKKSGRFNPLKWFKREDKKEEDADAASTTPAPADADKPAAKPNRSRASTPAPEQPAELPSEPTRVASRSAAPKIKPELAAIEDYRRIWKRSDREAILNRNLAILNALKTRSHPLYQPLVEDYASVVQQLVNGKDRGVADKLETLRQRRMQIQGKAKSVESFLDWYEASETQSYSNLFDDYLKLRDRLEREHAQRPDELSRYLDALEKEYE